MSVCFVLLLSSSSSSSVIIILHSLDTTTIVWCLHHTEDQRSRIVPCIVHVFACLSIAFLNKEFYLVSFHHQHYHDYHQYSLIKYVHHHCMVLALLARPEEHVCAQYCDRQTNIYYNTLYKILIYQDCRNTHDQQNCLGISQDQKPQALSLIHI